MQKYINLSDVHDAILNETFSLKVPNGEINVEVLSADFTHLYAEGLLAHDIRVKIIDQNGASEGVDLVVNEAHNDLSRPFENVRNSKEIKALMKNLVESVGNHVAKSYMSTGVKSMLKQAVFNYNEK